MEVNTIGIDIAKRIFQIHGVDKNYNGLKNQDKKIISLVGNFVKESIFLTVS